MGKISEEKKEPSTWGGGEIKCFLETIKELHVISLMDGKTFKTSEIFKKVEEVFNSKGFHRTSTQLLDKLKAMKKRFIAVTRALSKSGAGTEEKIKCLFFEELSEIFSYRPTLNQIGIDSPILPQDSGEDTSDYCVSNTRVSYVPSKNQDGFQKRKFLEIKSSCHSPPASTSTRCRRSASCDLPQSPFSPSPTASCVSEARNCRTTPTSTSQGLDDSDKPCTASINRNYIKHQHTQNAKNHNQV